MVSMTHLPKKDRTTSDQDTDQKTGNSIQTWINVHASSVSGRVTDYKLYYFVLYCVIADNACDE